MQLWPEGETEDVRRERGRLKAGKLYKIIFQTRGYFESSGRKCFYPWVDVCLTGLQMCHSTCSPHPADHVRGPEGG